VQIKQPGIILYGAWFGREDDMSNPRFELFKGSDGQFYFRLRAQNAELILNSEGYASRAGCENGIASVKENAPKDERYEIETAANGEFYFNLKAANGEIIGRSETYTTKQACENGIEAVKSAAPAASVEDMT
jgi:uncharacterized protein YegP (UPF0339 family)